MERSMGPRVGDGGRARAVRGMVGRRAKTAGPAPHGGRKSLAGPPSVGYGPFCRPTPSRGTPMLRRLAAPALALLLVPLSLPRADDAPKGDKDLEGDWELTSLIRNGDQEDIGRTPLKLAAKDGVLTTNEAGVVHKATYKTDPGKSPRTIDLTPQDGDDKGKVVLGLYDV